MVVYKNSYIWPAWVQGQQQETLMTKKKGYIYACCKYCNDHGSYDISWTMLVVHNRDQPEIQGTPNKIHTSHALQAAQCFYIVMKSFCGILLCCLDAPPIIKRNGIEFHDFWRIVKYAHFSILLLLFSFSQV